MTMRKTAIAVLTMLLLSMCGVAQQYTTNTNATTVKLADNVYLIHGGGGNVTALIGDDAILLIDSMFPETAAGLDAALKSLSPKPVRYVINTHWHADHSGGNEYFGGRGATIVSSEPTRAWLASRGNDYRPNAKGVPMATAGLPVVAFRDGLDVHFSGERLQMLPLGTGHSDGDAGAFLTKARIAAIGDTYFGAFPPRNVLAVQSAMERFLAILPDDVQIVPGHGGVLRKQELVEYSTALKESIRVMQAAIASGKTLDQVRQEKLLGRFEKYSTPYMPLEKFTSNLFGELSDLQHR